MVFDELNSELTRLITGLREKYETRKIHHTRWKKEPSIRQHTERYRLMLHPLTFGRSRIVLSDDVSTKMGTYSEHW